jgi:hypothetical protein
MIRMMHVHPVHPPWVRHCSQTVHGPGQVPVGGRRAGIPRGIQRAGVQHDGAGGVLHPPRRLGGTLQGAVLVRLISVLY